MEIQPKLRKYCQRASLVLPREPLMMPSIKRKHLYLLPDIFISLSSDGSTIRIPKERLFECYNQKCTILIGGVFLSYVLIGGPLLQSLMIEFDRINSRLGFCEPAASDTSTFPLITSTRSDVVQAKPLAPLQHILPVSHSSSAADDSEESQHSQSSSNKEEPDDSENDSEEDTSTNNAAENSIADLSKNSRKNQMITWTTTVVLFSISFHH